VTEAEFKPLNWKPDPNIGYTVVRRPDGGMHFTFTDTNKATLEHWREFSEQHLLDSDRLVSNLYDLRLLRDLPEDAIKVALEVNSDPSTRNIRLAVVVGNDIVHQAVQRIQDLTVPSGLDLEIFNRLDDAEAWLNRPLTLRI
jgi:hypothetical protein